MKASGRDAAGLALEVCAECGLVSSLRAAGAARMTRLSVVASDGARLAPCGRCRQVFLDNGGPTMLIDRGPGGRPVPLGDLLPEAFDTATLEARRAP